MSGRILTSEEIATRLEAARVPIATICANRVDFLAAQGSANVTFRPYFGGLDELCASHEALRAELEATKSNLAAGEAENAKLRAGLQSAYEALRSAGMLGAAIRALVALGEEEGDALAAVDSEEVPR